MRRLLSLTAAAAALIMSTSAFAQQIGDSTFQSQEFYQPEQEETGAEIPTCGDGEVLTFKNGAIACSDTVRFSYAAIEATSAQRADTATRADSAAEADRAAYADNAGSGGGSSEKGVVGSVFWYPDTSCPGGSVWAKGWFVDEATYPELAAAPGYRVRQGYGIEIPDLRSVISSPELIPCIVAR